MPRKRGSRKHQQHPDFTQYFPYRRHGSLRKNQQDSLELLTQKFTPAECKATFELPTGSGKTYIGGGFLEGVKAFVENEGKEGVSFYITPTKAQVDQVEQMLADDPIASPFKIIYGRGEHPCLYYPDENLKANEIPCSLLRDCIHRVDQESGATLGVDAEACPYLLQKYIAKQGHIIISTTAFWLFNELFARHRERGWKPTRALVIDEAHRLAHIARQCLSFEITDWHLERSVEILMTVDPENGAHLGHFLERMVTIIKRRKPRPRRAPSRRGKMPKRTSYSSPLLEPEETRELLGILMRMNAEALLGRISAAIASGVLDSRRDRIALKQLEVVARDIPRYVRAFEYSLESGDRKPLNYTVAFYTTKLEKGKRAQYHLVIRAYYVAPLLKRIIPSHAVAYSATIGDPEILGFETGINFPFYAFGSDFPAGNTRVFLPTDTPNLAVKARDDGEPGRVLTSIAQHCKAFAEAGHRSLMVVVSDRERREFFEIAKSIGLSTMSYGNGTSAKQAAAAFKGGEGDVLVGTVANYGEGVDLPMQIAPIIFFLRPGYPDPEDPAAIFEERRFGTRRWQLWNWRVMVEALQVRGRNVRSDTDIGVTFFISQQFRRFLYPSLPEWLKPAYRNELTFDECVVETIDILK